mgnify:FL=1
MPDKIVVVTGPTASGKTKLGVLLAKQLGGEVVSADSMQIYRGMDIGTAKPSAEEMDGVPHHMIDVAEPAESWSAAKFVDAAQAACQDILARGKLPIVVGGTGLYIDSLVQGRSFGAVDETGLTRQELEERYDEMGGKAMLRELAQLDPERAAKLHPADKKRIVRAYEVYLLTGRTITELDRESREKDPAFEAAYIILGRKDREELYRRIDARVDEMVARGLFEEVAALLAGGLDSGSTAMQAIGYKEAAETLRGECSREEAVDKIKRETRRYAKRQLTWLRQREGALRIDWEGTPDFASAVRDSTAFLLRCGIR